MEKQHIKQDIIEKTMKSVETIEKVNVSPFFKDRTMQRLFREKEVEITTWSWFTPKMQLATLVCLVALNIYTFSQLSNETYSENVNEFAETYGLAIATETSLLN